MGELINKLQLLLKKTQNELNEAVNILERFKKAKETWCSKCEKGNKKNCENCLKANSFMSEKRKEILGFKKKIMLIENKLRNPHLIKGGSKKKRTKRKTTKKKTKKPKVHTGPRGGKYIIKKGKKVYV